MENEEEEEQQKRHHFVLVHGAGHGAWCWYKVTTLLRSAGHRVTALDLAGGGVDPRDIHRVATFADYSRPLMEAMAALPPRERVVLVGHSFGGMSLALAMDRFPEKIAAAVFVTAFMPDYSSPPSYVVEQYTGRTPAESWMDTRFCFDRGPEKPFTSMLFGPNFASSKLYQLCSQEEITLAGTLIRTSNLFVEDLSNTPPFSKERYGSVDRVYIVCRDDLAIPEEFQLWTVENCPVAEVKTIDGADHMAMVSKPSELCRCLLDVAAEYTY